MEIDVTYMVEDRDNMIELSGSCVEHGQHAGKITWGNSVAYAADKPLLATEEEKEAARAHFREYGAWDDAEIAAWSEEELQGLMVQDVAAAIREMEGYPTYEAFCKARDGGGNVYPGDDGKWYFYLGL